MFTTLKRTCSACGWVGTQEELLRADSPFDASILLSACPKCHTVEGVRFPVLCDTQGCTNLAGAGDQVVNGRLRRVCEQHRKEQEQEEPTIDVDPDRRHCA